MLSRLLRFSVLNLLVVLALLAASCSDSDDGGEAVSPTAQPNSVPADPEPEPVAEPTAESEPAAEPTAIPEPEYGAASFAVQPSAEQLHVLNAAPGTALELVNGSGEVVADGVVDDMGSYLWRDIPVDTYTVRTSSDPLEVSASAVVSSVDDVPNSGLYTSQELVEGFNYIATRDGTTLSATVWLPAGDGPFPTVVEYSGYSPSNPDEGTFAQIYTTMGYAYVGVNMRGTGCSGGSFEFFEPMQNLDGYDVIETVAAQSWVMHNHVGMVGISYPGISQLFVAQTQPPSLAAITPLSVLDDSYRSTLYPGGILNTGFAVSWSNERQSDAEPYGQGWEQGMVDGGDTTCEANQNLRLQNTDAYALILENPYYNDQQGAPIAPDTFVDKINVPVYLAGAWQDEQTGGHFPAMLDDFTGSPALFATMVNGSHTESLSPEIFARYSIFLDLYVAKRAPSLGAASLVAPLLSSTLTGASASFAPDDRWDGLTYEEALELFESQDRIRILFEEGAGDPANLGAQVPSFEASWPSWPVPGEVTAWYFQADGSLAAAAPDGPSDPTSYVSDPNSVPATFYEGGSSGIWTTDVELNWEPIPEGTGAGWVSPVLTEDVVTVGFGSADLWIRASEDDVDLEVTISEVRPDGQEVYVQSGWLRASQRALADEATELRPVHTHSEDDVAPLPSGEFALARVEIFPFAHAFRAGSRVRITVDAPGGARPTWAFDFTYDNNPTVEIAHDDEHPSRLVLNVVEGVAVPAELPPCGALRSQPCRPYADPGE